MSKRPTVGFYVRMNRAGNGWYVEIYGRNAAPRFMVASTADEALEIAREEMREREKLEARAKA